MVARACPCARGWQLKYASSQGVRPVADPDPISISEVARSTGLQSSALRYYEKAGLIAPAGRAGGRRQYDPSVLRRLAAIALLQEAGFTIAEVREVLGAGNESWRTLARQKLGELD